jgi:HD-GYP domain-containing protein (c-di-GMP phosphodiesterase class II)
MRAFSALITAIAVKDPATHRHSRRTATFAVALARDFDLPADSVGAIALAAVLHDVGKIQIPDAILHKPGVLDEDEWAVMRTHSDAGARMVERAGLPTLARWIRHLHERFDGLGYPDGIGGGEIPFESRLLHVADTLEAMTSARPYRSPALVEEALDALAESAGSQLDPVFAHRLAALVRSGDLHVEQEPVTVSSQHAATMTPLIAGASLAAV